MKILYSWLKDFIDVDLPPQMLADKLTGLGIEVAEIEAIGADFDGVITAKIMEINKHPNADKLSLVTLDTGSGLQTVVCGAKNFKIGDIVPLAKVGARLGLNILKPAEIRGVKSEGMMCSSDELGLAKERAKGILILDNSLPPGKDVSELYGKKDYIFDLEITPNRGDLLSHYGVARELSILLDLPLKKPELKNVAVSGEPVIVELLEPAACPRYSGRVVRGAKNTESPQWMKDRLTAMGVNPKNALVDITNYVLFEIGHPLHAFDFSSVDGGEIKIRYAREGEDFKTLDGKELKLDTTNLVIAGKENPSALAGVMGGINSGIKPDTQDVFIESAYFAPPVINKTSKKRGISSDSSQRFERGTDINRTLWALERASNLVSEFCGGEFSPVTDIYPEEYHAPAVTFTPAEINKILGMEISEEKLKEIFSKLGASFKAGSDKWTFTSGAHRRDLNTKWDLAEEAARFYGFENIPVTDEPVHVEFKDNPKNTDINKNMSDVLISAGFSECKNFDFISEKDLSAFGAVKENALELANPLTSDWQYLRPSLLPGLLKNILFNQNHGVKNFKFFEIGKEYLLAKGYPSENWTVAAVCCGKTDLPYFTDKPAKADFFYMKGIAAKLLEKFGAVKLVPSANPLSYIHPKVSMDIMDGKKQVGFIGRLHPALCAEYDLKNDEVYVFSFAVKPLEKEFNAQDFPAAKDVAACPSSGRDLSVVADKTLSFAEIERAVNTAGVWSNFNYSLTDIYEGPNLPEGKKSVSLSFNFWLNDRTLVDKEIEELTQKILTSLKAVGAEIRK